MSPSIVQLDPEKTDNKAFAGCFLIVTERRPWGVVGYIQGVGDRNGRGGVFWYRAARGTYKLCGHAEWTIGEGAGL